MWYHATLVYDKSRLLIISVCQVIWLVRLSLGNILICLEMLISNMIKNIRLFSPNSYSQSSCMVSNSGKLNSLCLKTFNTILHQFHLDSHLVATVAVGRELTLTNHDHDQWALSIIEKYDT